MSEFVGLAGWALAGGGYVGVAKELGPDGKVKPGGRSVDCIHHYHRTEGAARDCAKRLAERMSKRAATRAALNEVKGS